MTIPKFGTNRKDRGAVAPLGRAPNQSGWRDMDPIKDESIRASWKGKGGGVLWQGAKLHETFDCNSRHPTECRDYGYHDDPFKTWALPMWVFV